MTKINKIRQKLEALKPQYCEVIDESHRHASHTDGNSVTHLKIKIISSEFIGKSSLERHKILHKLLADELTKGLHALSIDARPPAQ